MPTFPQLNGSIFYDPNFESDKIYWIDLGAKRWIANEDTYNGVFGEAGEFNKQQEDLSQIDAGPDVEPGSILVRGGSDSKIYLVSQGVARWIPSEGIRNQYNLLGKVHSVPPTLIEEYPAGPAFAP
jgi:hypothetical protein